jgi:hypothetical protein
MLFNVKINYILDINKFTDNNKTARWTIKKTLKKNSPQGEQMFPITLLFFGLI